MSVGLALLESQRAHRIHPRGSPRREPTGECPNDGQDSGTDHERSRSLEWTPYNNHDMRCVTASAATTPSTTPTKARHAEHLADRILIRPEHERHRLVDHRDMG